GDVPRGRRGLPVQQISCRSTVHPLGGIVANPRRRRAGRERAGQDRRIEVPQRPEEWPGSGDIGDLCDLDAITAAALAEATADDMLTVLHSMPNGYRQYVLGVLGLRSAVTVNRGMAAQLLARLRADKAGSCGPLLYAIVIPVLDLLCHATAPAPWAVMFGREARPAVAAYAEHPHTAARIAYVACHYSPALLRAGLAAAIADHHPPGPRPPPRRGAAPRPPRAPPRRPRARPCQARARVPADAAGPGRQARPGRPGPPPRRAGGGAAGHHPRRGTARGVAHPGRGPPGC